MDAKEVGLSIKSIVLGLGGAVAGVAGGPAAAEGVAKADKGLDRLIGIDPPADKGTRGERFDRADYGARAPAQKPPARSSGSTRASLAEERAQSPEKELAEPVGDEQITTGFLQSRGWSSDTVQEILDGPQSEAAQGRESRPTGETESLRTFEVYGVKDGTVVPLMTILDQKDGRWQVTSGAQVRATDQPTVGLGLAGVPGRWREFYPKQSPEAYGLHAEKAVLYWEPRIGRALAASAGLLTQLLGRNWRSTVYRMEEEHG